MSPTGERLLILRVGHIRVDVDLCGDHGLAAWDVLNHVAAIGQKKRYWCSSLVMILPSGVLDRDRAALRIGDRFTLGVEIEHLDQPLIDRLHGGRPGDPSGCGQALRDNRDHGRGRADAQRSIQRAMSV